MASVEVWLQAEQSGFLVLSGAVFYLLAFFGLWSGGDGGWNRKYLLGLLAMGLLLHGTAIALRWLRLGHGPFGNLYEILTSNLWSLTLATTIFIACFGSVYRAARGAVPVLLVLLLWLLVTEARDSHLPATYRTIWLYVHLLLGKVYLGCLLIAVALAVAALYDYDRPYCDTIDSSLPPAALVELAFRFAAAALVFESGMLLAGAIWAQDAWGRYWAWDPLETWSFLSWLMLVASIHLRMLTGIPARIPPVLLLVVFTLAFLTFFGVPFISTSPHKGAV